MTRLVLTLLALVGLALSATTAPAIAAPAPAHRDWTVATTKLPDGTFVIGNPAAKVKLVEYLSYTCPHCAEFVAQSKPVLVDQMVRDGSTSLELRPIVRDPLDFTATLLVRCAGPRRLLTLHDAVFAAQDDWIKKGGDWLQANVATLQAKPPVEQVHMMADQSGLTALARANGMTPAQVNACFANDTDLNRVVALANAAIGKVPGTPAFFINGQQQAGVYNWAGLQPALRKAGAR